MPDAWVEHGIGETRAAVVDNAAITEAYVERHGAWRAGDVRSARLTTILVPGVRGIVTADGQEALLTPLPPRLTEGASLTVEVVREAIAERGRHKLPKVVASDTPLESGKTLAKRLELRGFVVRTVPDSGGLEAFGWGEVIEAARTGYLPFPGGSLVLTPTPAMTVIDVDGDLPPANLALAAADAVAAVVRLFDLSGSIGVDFPTVGDRVVRQAIGARLDAALPPPFERTAVNGFGFVQIVRPRVRASLVEVLRDAVPTAALALLQRAEREPPGRCRLVAAPAIIGWLEARPELAAELARRRGGAAALHADPRLRLEENHVETTL